MPDENSTLKLTELLRQASEEGDEEKLLALTKRINELLGKQDQQEVHCAFAGGATNTDAAHGYRRPVRRQVLLSRRARDPAAASRRLAAPTRVVRM